MSPCQQDKICSFETDVDLLIKQGWPLAKNLDVFGDACLYHGGIHADLGVISIKYLIVSQESG